MPASVRKVSAATLKPALPQDGWLRGRAGGEQGEGGGAYGKGIDALGPGTQAPQQRPILRAETAQTQQRRPVDPKAQQRRRQGG